MRLLIILCLLLSKIAYSQSITTDSSKAVFNYVVGLYDSCHAENVLLDGALKYSDTIIYKQQDLLESKQYETDKLKTIIGTYKSDSAVYRQVITRLESIAVKEKRIGKLKGLGYGLGGGGFGLGLGVIISYFTIHK